MQFQKLSCRSSTGLHGTPLRSNRITNLNNRRKTTHAVRATANQNGFTDHNATDQPYFPEPEENFLTQVGTIDIVDSDEGEVDEFGESTVGNLHFTNDVPLPDSSSILGFRNLDEIMTIPYPELKTRVHSLLAKLQVPPSNYPASLPQRAIFCSRTINFRSIQAIGYDMDYTLVHYDVEAWEGRAWEYGMSVLGEMGCPIQGLRFQSDLVIRGLIIDTHLGNIVKADRFGFIKRAMHGTRMLTPAEVRKTYGRELVNLKNEKRWVFLNTLFSVSEAVMYAQMIDRLDEGVVPDKVCAMLNYQHMWSLVSRALFLAHVEGKLKAEIIEDPGKFVELDPDMAQTLLDQRGAGKELVLITNSDWHYTDAIMTYSYDKFLPDGMRWRDIFDLVIVNSRKPDFFRSNQSLYQLATQDGLLRPAMKMERGNVYIGGSARMVETALGVSGDDILYIGDHIYTDAALAKLEFRWRTCLIVRELEREIEALALGREHRERLKDALNKKDQVGDAFNNLRLLRQRLLQPHSPCVGVCTPAPWSKDLDEAQINEAIADLLTVMERLDEEIAPAIESDGQHFNQRWGYLGRTGVNDRSQLVRQIEKYADIYTSRVSNFLRYSPYSYFRSPTQSMAHDRPSVDMRVTARSSSSGSDSDTAGNGSRKVNGATTGERTNGAASAKETAAAAKE